RTPPGCVVRGLEGKAMLFEDASALAVEKGKGRIELSPGCCFLGLVGLMVLFVLLLELGKKGRELCSAALEQLGHLSMGKFSGVGMALPALAHTKGKWPGPGVYLRVSLGGDHGLIDVLDGAFAVRDVDGPVITLPGELGKAIGQALFDFALDG